MSEIHFIDTTLRDGQLSLWALGMRTGAMLTIAEQMDQCGFQSMEFFGFSGFIKFVREHRENPWDWIGIGAKRFTRTRLRHHGGLGSGFEKIPRSVLKLMMERVVFHGITLTRASNPWNDYAVLKIEMEELRTIGMDVVANVIYSVSPRHTDEYYYPIMVTPLAQFVGSQAAINVIVGERYKEVTDQTIQYALGHWGKQGALLMDPDVKDKILSRSRAKDWEGWEPPEPTIEQVRRKFGAPGVSDEELILRVIAGVDSVETMLAAGSPKEYLNAKRPLMTLIGELSKLNKWRQIYIQKGDLSLRLERQGEPGH